MNSELPSFILVSTLYYVFNYHVFVLTPAAIEVGNVTGLAV